jgi:hypothetical protein
MMGGHRTQKAVHRTHSQLVHPQAAKPGNDVPVRGVLVGKRGGGCLPLLGYLCEEGFAERGDASVPGDCLGAANANPVPASGANREGRPSHAPRVVISPTLVT